MNNSFDETRHCIICFHENVDTQLSCCNKRIHNKCIKEWFTLNNVDLSFASCPHCMKRIIIEKIISNTNKYCLSDYQIEMINNNSNNKIPKNLFINDFENNLLEDNDLENNLLESEDEDDESNENLQVNILINNTSVNKICYALLAFIFFALFIYFIYTFK